MLKEAERSLPVELKGSEEKKYENSLVEEFLESLRLRPSMESENEEELSRLKHSRTPSPSPLGVSPNRSLDSPMLRRSIASSNPRAPSPDDLHFTSESEQSESEESENEESKSTTSTESLPSLESLSNRSNSNEAEVWKFLGDLKQKNKKYLNELDKDTLFNPVLLEYLEPKWIQFAETLPQIKLEIIAAMQEPPESWARLIVTLLFESKEQITVEEFISKVSFPSLGTDFYQLISAKVA